MAFRSEGFRPQLHYLLVMLTITRKKADSGGVFGILIIQPSFHSTTLSHENTTNTPYSQRHTHYMQHPTPSSTHMHPPTATFFAGNPDTISRLRQLQLHSVLDSSQFRIICWCTATEIFFGLVRWNPLCTKLSGPKLCLYASEVPSFRRGCHAHRPFTDLVPHHWISTSSTSSPTTAVTLASP